MRIRDNLGGLTAASSNPRTPNVTFPTQIGKVFGVLLDENTPSKELFEKNGGWSGIGTVFYLDYNQSKDLQLEDININLCKIAKPFITNGQDYPLIGELIYIIEAPSSLSQINTTQTQKYYLGSINIWNNNQHNAPGNGELGKTFIENNDIRLLYPFEGDRIIQGRKGNGIRFGSTVKSKSKINNWSNIGNNGDPILIITNGYVLKNKEELKPNLEDINIEKSSIWMTSTQSIPLNPGASITNPRVNTILPKNYYNPQIILNSDRIIINSKKDEVLIFSKKNIELNTDNILNLNAGEITNINSPKIMLGLEENGEYPDEPALLGGKTHDLILVLLESLSNLASSLSETSVTTSEGTFPILQCNSAGEKLSNNIEKMIEVSGTITSETVYLK